VGAQPIKRSGELRRGPMRKDRQMAKLGAETFEDGERCIVATAGAEFGRRPERRSGLSVRETRERRGAMAVR